MPSYEDYLYAPAPFFPAGLIGNLAYCLHWIEDGYDFPEQHEQSSKQGAELLMLLFQLVKEGMTQQELEAHLRIAMKLPVTSDEVTPEFVKKIWGELESRQPPEP